MKLQLLRPTLVFAGAWNPAIFQLGWVAKNVHEIPAGADVRVDEVTVTDQNRPPKRIHYMQDLGIFVSQTRLEIYPTAIDKESLRVTEEKVAKILELLPHTPISGFGINFFFEDENAPVDLRNKIRSRDGLSDIISVSAESLTSRAPIEPGVQLNLQRSFDGSVVNFNFNYHHSDIKADVISEIAKSIEKCLNQSAEILKLCYGISDYDISKPGPSQEMDDPGHA